MANIRLIKGRIKSAKNIAQITKAMEMVAASKMKKAQQAAVSGSLYASKIFDMVMLLAARSDYKNHPFLVKRAIKNNKKLFVLISTNKGLCGGLNTYLFRHLNQLTGGDQNIDYVTLGKKGADFLTRINKTIMADFSQTVPFYKAVPALVELISNAYIQGSYDSVDLVYNEFVSVITQKPKSKTILPLRLENINQTDSAIPVDFLIEPDPKTIFDLLLPQYLENQVRDAVLQSEASEHSSRMVAMKNATDNALTLATELTLLYNKVRQEKITYEITDMVTARLAAES